MSCLSALLCSFICITLRHVVEAQADIVVSSPPNVAMLDMAEPLMMEPLPEYIAARPETRLVSRYWAELESRRMSTLKMCELRLWDKMQKNVGGVPMEVPVPSKGENIVKRLLTAEQTEPLVPAYEGQAVVQDIETSLKKCFDELRKLENRDSGKTASVDAFLTAIGREVDQIESCQEVGGALSFEMTASAVAKIKSQVAKQPDLLEAIDFLKSTLIKLKLDKDSCIASLGLPQSAVGDLSYPEVQGSPQVKIL